MHRLYIKLMVFIRSFIMNIFYLTFNFNKILNGLRLKKYFKVTVKNIVDVKNTMELFEWTSDGKIDWRPWILTFLIKNMKDDCDGAAIFGKWLLKNIGIDSQLVLLYNEKQSHLICASYDNKYIISNNSVIEIQVHSTLEEIIKLKFPHYDGYMVL